MASRNYKALGRAAKKIVRPPAKTVVFSLMAFLIVAACPYLIIQTEAVNEDSLYVEVEPSYEIEPGVFTSDLILSSSVKSSDGGSIANPDVISLGDSKYYYPGDDTLSSYGWTIFHLNKDLNNYDIRKVEVMITPDDSDCVIKLVRFSSDREKEFVYDEESGVYSFEFSYVDSLNKDVGDCTLTTQMLDSSGAVCSSPCEVELRFYTLEDDYTGSIIAFAAGIGLVVLAVLSTSLVNPIRWGKR